MNFVQHLNVRGLHAPFAPSQPAWLRYDDQKIIDSLRTKQAAALGTRLHEWARETIELGIKQPKSKKTLCAYVNDAIGFKMQPEVVLYYSDNFFGTADTISFRDDVLRIHDLKTGVSNVHMEQLKVYAALFCLEYKIKPSSITTELRIYQNDEVLCYEPPQEELVYIMDTIIHLNKVIEQNNLLGG